MQVNVLVCLEVSKCVRMSVCVCVWAHVSELEEREREREREFIRVLWNEDGEMKERDKLNSKKIKNTA